jgi:hypothetical protein
MYLCWRRRTWRGWPSALRDKRHRSWSITATGFQGFIAKFKKHGLDWREFNVPKAKLWQLFVYDPSGVQLEIGKSER